MSIVVQKYGGSSVADTDKLQRVANRIVETREAGHDVVVVVSAMGNTTDELLDLATQLNPTPNRRELDMLLSVGERISMTLLSMAIHALGHEAISFTGSQSGIITNDSHSNARIIEVRPFRIQDELARGRIVIVAGYQGTSYKREVTTLGRGGSDMTAIALAGALQAERCEIYSDVDGVYTSDPRVVLDAERLTSITADEMLELARHGAQVLHDQAIAYARRHQIALLARAAHGPGKKGTLVRPDGWPDSALTRAQIAPRAVASVARVVVAIAPLSELEELTGTIEADGELALMLADLDEEHATLVLDPTNAANLDACVARLQSEGREVHADTCSVSLVGQDIGRDPGWVTRARRSLLDMGLKPERILVQQHVIVALLAHSHREDAMNALHALVAV